MKWMSFLIKLIKSFKVSNLRKYVPVVVGLAELPQRRGEHRVALVPASSSAHVPLRAVDVGALGRLDAGRLAIGDVTIGGSLEKPGLHSLS